MPTQQTIGMTTLLSRQDGVVGACCICPRDRHYGVRIETVRESTGRRVTMFACYDCVEVAHLIAVGRMPCEKCGGDGIAR